MRNRPYNTNKNEYTPPPPDVPLPVYQNRYNQPQRKKSRSSQPPKKDSNPIFSEDFMDFVGLLAKWVGQIGVLIILIGLSIGAMTIDIGVGTLSLSLAFTHDIPFRNIVVTSDTMAGALSWFTSGIQVFQRIRWITKRGKVSKTEEYLMYGVMGVDSLLDMAGWGYLLTGNTPRAFSFVGMSFFDWMIMLLGTGACLIAENLVVYLASLRTSGRSLKDLLKVRKK